jgi:hypothetical protein
MIKVENRKITTLVCVEAICDRCKSQVRLESDSNISPKVSLDSIDISKIPGRHFVHNFGYGTENDSKKIEITLCDNCIMNVFAEYVNAED